MRVGALFAILGTACSRDLARVHTPELLTVDDASAMAHGPGTGPSRTDGSQVPPKSEWKIYTSLSERNHLSDGQIMTVAFAPRPSSKDQYLLVDLGSVTTVSEVVQIHSSPNGYPRRYRIDVAGEHNFPYELAFVGEGVAGSSRAAFKKPASCRFLRVTLLDTSDHPWDVAELEIH